MAREDFIEQIASFIRKHAPEYGIKCCSAIIAQACLESRYGESELANYHNYFGMKCGTSWKGESVNFKTNEEYTPGKLTSIRDNFRAYPDMESGVEGYFAFISVKRYKNLVGITDPKTYLETIKADGYATSSKYVANNMKVVERYNLTRFDDFTAIEPQDESGAFIGTQEAVTNPKTASRVLDMLRSWIGYSESNQKYSLILNIYNNHKPLARGYAVKPTDSWCAVTVSAAFIITDMVDMLGGTECSCGQFVEIFKKKGIWIEDGSIEPKPGDIILYDWQMVDGWPDHIGVVEKVEDGHITAIEGNYDDEVKRRMIEVGDPRIRGFARPQYDEETEEEVSAWFDDGVLSKDVKYTGKVITAYLNVRRWPGKEYPQIKSYPVIKAGLLVDVCDGMKARDGSDWYYVRINNKAYGFVSGRYIARV